MASNGIQSTHLVIRLCCISKFSNLKSRPFFIKTFFSDFYINAFYQSSSIRNSLHAHRFRLLWYEVGLVSGVQVIFRTSCVFTCIGSSKRLKEKVEKRSFACKLIQMSGGTPKQKGRSQKSSFGISQGVSLQRFTAGAPLSFL